MEGFHSLFNSELPIIQAPMAGVQGSELAIAVSNAGGVGSLPCAMLSLEQLRAQLNKIKEETDKPFNVNFFCHTAPEPDEKVEQEWRELLAPYFHEYSIDPDNIKAGPGRRPFSQEALDVLAEFKPAVVSFHFGLPSKDLLDQVKDWGAKVISSATTVEEALWLEANGADGIIAQGFEAGGHRGMFLTDDLNTQLGTLELVRQVVQAVNIPVIAAGGIADAEGVQAALAMGACAAQVGSAYLLCPEATTSSVHRQVLASSHARHTAVTNLFSGRPARGIVNRVISELGPINNKVPKFPLATTAITALRSAAEKEGSGDFSPLWAGQNAQFCREIAAGELTRLLGEKV